jgi:hypothetical protein
MYCHKCGADWGVMKDLSPEDPREVPWIPPQFGAEFIRSEDGGVFVCRTCGAKRAGIIVGGNILRLLPGE